MSKGWRWWVVACWMGGGCFSSFADEGTYALEFLSLGIGARALGMGSAFVALADDATAAYWNPSGLVEVPSRAFATQHADLFQQGTDSFISRGLAQQNYVSLVLPFENETKIAFSWTRVGVDDIPRVTFVDVNGDGVLGTFRDTNVNGKKDPDETYLDTPIVAETFSNTDSAYGISYARRLSQTLSVGGTLKLIRQRLYVNTGTGFGVDVGATYRYGRYGRLALVIQDATGTRVRWDTAGRPTFVRPRNFRLGVGGVFSYRRWFRLGVAADVDVNTTVKRSEESGKARLHLGGEVFLADRFGFRFGSDAGSLTAGAGFRIPVRSVTFSLDYAFTTHPDLGDAQRLSMTGFF